MVRKTPKQSSRVSPGDLLLIKEAAKLLGVSEMTLRRWDKAKKFIARRHPLNHFRLYRRADVLRLRKRIETGRAA
jgi:excisionase family DNA binding protein